jgi:hypothetical protein
MLFREIIVENYKTDINIRFGQNNDLLRTKADHTRNQKFKTRMKSQNVKRVDIQRVICLKSNVVSNKRWK